MNMKMIEQIASSRDENGKMNKYLLTKIDVADLLDITRQSAAIWLKEHSIPWYKILGRKKYLLTEIMEAMERKDKWVS